MEEKREMPTIRLTPLQKAFCQYYVYGDREGKRKFSATHAAELAGYSKKSSGTKGHLLLKDPNVRLQIDEYRYELFRKVKMGGEELVAELSKIARTRVSDLMEFDGESVRYKSFEEMGEAEAAVADVETQSWRDDKGSEVQRVRVRMHDKVGALDKLAKILGLYEERAGDTNIQNNTVIMMPENGF